MQGMFSCPEKQSIQRQDMNSQNSWTLERVAEVVAWAKNPKQTGAATQMD
jgi:hypothetical protein